jgi:hypothetical protein
VGAGLAAGAARTAQGGSITSARPTSTPLTCKKMVAATATRFESAGQQLTDSKVKVMETSMGAFPVEYSLKREAILKRRNDIIAIFLNISNQKSPVTTKL